MRANALNAECQISKLVTASLRRVPFLLKLVSDTWGAGYHYLARLVPMGIIDAATSGLSTISGIGGH